jgi:hypothetical protein
VNYTVSPIKGKGNVTPVLNYVIKHYAMQACGGSGGIGPPFLLRH